MKKALIEELGLFFMNTIDKINRALYRELKDGRKYDHLFPKSNCDKTKLAKGNTSVAVANMQYWALKYAHESTGIAQELYAANLDQLVNNVQDFIFWHFQYSIDKKEQDLKSPSCAWATRKSGHDCKTYSILASTILLNLGVKHYMRRIKQHVMPEAYTHVYVVIPRDQKTGKLNNDYLVIDGTVQINTELPFLEKSDLYMEPDLVINGLASPSLFDDDCGCGCGGNCGGSSQDMGLGISFGDISGMFSGGWSPSCWGGTYDKGDFDRYAQLVTSGFDNLYYPFNDALRSLDMEMIERLANEIIITSQQLFDQTQRTASKKWRSSCSRSTTRGFHKLAAYFDNIYQKAFFPFLQKYFNISFAMTTVANNDHDIELRAGGKGMKKAEFVRTFQVKAITQMSLKTGVKQIPKFEFTPYLLDQVEVAEFNLNEFLNTLVNTAVSISDNNGSSSNNGGTSHNNGSNSHNNGSTSYNNGSGISHNNNTTTGKSNNIIGQVLLVGGIGTLAFIAAKNNLTKIKK